MITNATAIPGAYDLPPLPTYTIKPLPPLVSGFPDQYLGLVLLVVAYWGVSLFFHLLDVYDLFPQYRLHTPAEILKRNHVSRWDVFKDVIIQQVVQTLFGIALAFIEDPPTYGREEYDVAVWAQRLRLLQRGIPTVMGMVGIDAASLAKNLRGDYAILAGVMAGGVYPELTQTTLVSGELTTAPAFASWELLVAKAIYWVLIPAAQFITAVCIIDTYQYFVHRAMHMNKWLYTTFHARHHRLYVPYAYGALYNHPVEGFVLDTCGAGMAYLLTGMTVRQSMWLFTCTTIKTVDDHCGYSFPWDPLQRLSSNNAGYHDVHHQSWGIKTNFSQPFFTFWDGFFGTKWTGGDVSARYERARIAAQKKVDDEAKAVIGSSRSESSSVETAAPYDGVSTTTELISSHAEPRIPSGKATQQALSGRQQTLDDIKGGGVKVLAEESAEEVREQKSLRRTPRKRTTSLGWKGFVDRVGESLHGKGTGVLGVDSGR